MKIKVEKKNNAHSKVTIAKEEIRIKIGANASQEEEKAIMNLSESLLKCDFTGYPTLRGPLFTSPEEDGSYVTTLCSGRNHHIRGFIYFNRNMDLISINLKEMTGFEENEDQGLRQNT